jgi:diacylglycerol kinase (ATP)
MDRRVTVITNPTAGRGRGARAAAAAVAHLRAAGLSVRPHTSRDARDVGALVRRAVADDTDAVVVCGGDGMVHLALQELAGGPTPLGIIPAGTGNDVARYLDIPRADPRAAAEVIVTGRVREIDLARTEAGHFATVLASGFDSLVNERANRMRWPGGQLRYVLATLAELRVFEPLAYTLTVDGRVVEVEAMLVAVGNGPSYGGGMRVVEDARLDDGLVDLAVIGPMRRSRLVRVFPRLYTGTVARIPEYTHHRARSVTVDAPGIVAYADGERLAGLPLTVTAEPRALSVHVPG